MIHPAVSKSSVKRTWLQRHGPEKKDFSMLYYFEGKFPVQIEAFPQGDVYPPYRNMLIIRHVDTPKDHLTS